PGTGVRPGRTPALCGTGGPALCVYCPVLHGGIVRGNDYDACLAHESLDLPPVWQPGLSRRQLDKLPGHDRRGPGAAGHRPCSVPPRRYRAWLNTKKWKAQQNLTQHLTSITMEKQEEEQLKA